MKNVCPKCNGRKYIELDKIGLVTAECDECKGAGVVEDVLTQDNINEALPKSEEPTVPLSVEDIEAISKDSFITIDEEEANDNSTGVEPDNQPFGKPDPGEPTVSKKSKTRKKPRKKSR